jgi:hypothetical protein
MGALSNTVLNGSVSFNNSSTNFWYNTPETSLSYFTLNSNVITNTGTAVEPL